MLGHKRPHALLILAPIALSFLSDAAFSVSDFRHTIPGYLALAVEAASSSTLDHTQGVLLPALGSFATSFITIIGAFVLSSMGYTFTQFLVSCPGGMVMTIADHLLA